MATWKDWLATGVQVAQIATNVLAKVIAAPQGAQLGDGVYATGNVQWWLDPVTKKVVAFNPPGTVEAMLAYTLATPEGGVGVVQPLRAGSHYDASADLADFRQGQVTAAPSTPADASAQIDSRLVTFTIASLVLGLTARILTGVEVSVGRDKTTGLFKISISAPSVPFKASVTATDGSGNSVTAQGQLGAGQAVHVLTINLPPGVDLSPSVHSLAVELTMPVAAYEQLTASRQAKIVQGVPDFLKQPAAAR